MFPSNICPGLDALFRIFSTPLSIALPKPIWSTTLGISSKGLSIPLAFANALLA